MAATRSFTRSAVAAAVFVFLSACGGGETLEQAQTQVASAEVVQALSGKAALARERILAVSAPATKSGFSLTSDIKLAAATEERAQKQATTASAVLSLTAKAENVLKWAEKNFKQFFPMEQVSQNACIPEGCFTYRLYPETGNIVGVKTDGPDAGGIYLYGTYVGNILTRYASIDDGEFRCIADVDSCRPTVISTAPQNGAVDVSAKGTVMSFVFSEPINCAGIDGTAEVGTDVKVIVTISCRSASRTVTITPAENRWPFGIEACMTISGVQNLAGYGSPSVTTCFTTRVVSATERLYVASASPEWTGEKAAITLDVGSGASTSIAFPGVPGFNDLRNVAVDPLMGKAYFAGLGTFRLYSIDLETNLVLEPIAIDPGLEYIHAVQGLTVTDREVCMAFARADVQGYPRQNQLDCRSLTTGKQTFLSSKGFLGGSTNNLVTGLRYLPFGSDKMLYALAAPTEVYFFESGANWIREGYKPGTVGTVMEVDTKNNKTRMWNVGSAPQGIDRDLTTGDLYVVNAGDRSLSIIRANGGGIETFSLASSFTGFQRPMRIKIDQARKRFYVTDYLGAVIAFSLADRRELARASVGVLTIDLAYTLSGKLAVTSMEGTVVVIDPDTFTEVKRFVGAGPNIYGIASSR